MHTTGTFASPELNRALGGAASWSGPSPGWARAIPIELWILFHELEKAGAPYDGLGRGDHDRRGRRGGRHRRAEGPHPPSITSGSRWSAWATASPTTAPTWPSITTKAVRDGDEWVINGAKMWTTMAHEADWIILLTRTDPELPKHKGLTMFIMPMDTPGISVDAGAHHGQRAHQRHLLRRRAGRRRRGAGRGRRRLEDDERRPAFERGGWAVPSWVPLLRHFHEWAGDQRSDRSALWRLRADGPGRHRPAGRTAADPALRMDRGDRWPARAGGLDDQGVRHRGLPTHLQRLQPAGRARRAAPIQSNRARPPTAGSSTTPATPRWSRSTAAPPRSTATTSPSATSACRRPVASRQVVAVGHALPGDRPRRYRRPLTCPGEPGGGRGNRWATTAPRAGRRVRRPATS